MDFTYSITYRVGTSKHDEQGFVIRNVPAARLAAKIDAITRKPNHTIYSVQRND